MSTSYNNGHEKAEILSRVVRDEKQRLEYNHEHHFNEVIKEIASYNKEDGYDKFEEISLFTKRKNTKLSFQYYIPPYVPKRSIEMTPHEENVFVRIFGLNYLERS
jgi:hypothetical protein